MCAQDLPRTFPANRWVAAAAGQAALRRVLLAFSVHAPGVGYCQGMNYLAAMALLALACAEESAFWVLAAMIDDGGPPRRPHAMSCPPVREHGCQSCKLRARGRLPCLSKPSTRVPGKGAHR